MISGLPVRRGTALLVAVSLFACSRSHVCNGGDLATVKTAAAERAALQRIAATCHPLSVAAYDGRGVPVPFSDPAWTAKVRRVRIGAGGAPFDHEVIDGKSVLVLMNE